MSFDIICGDALTVLKSMPDQSVHCCVTSPPYWGLRDYGTSRWEGGSSSCDHRQNRGDQGKYLTGQRADRTHTGVIPYKEQCGRCGAMRLDAQLGLERTPEEYVLKLVEVFRDVRRVLRDDGTLWMNLGDCYATGAGAVGEHPGAIPTNGRTEARGIRPSPKDSNTCAIVCPLDGIRARGPQPRTVSERSESRESTPSVRSRGAA